MVNGNTKNNFMQPFDINLPKTIRYPIVLSLPHIGTQFPHSIASQIKQHLLPPDDTDWYLDKLYQFATELEIPVIKSVYSRWVIDLNRHPDNQPLYHDGRIITDTCTATTFLGESIYADERIVVEPVDVAQRKLFYFDPYHNALSKLLEKVLHQFGVVLLWDGHSIRRSVSTISNTPFPDFIIGTNKGKTIPASLSSIVEKVLKQNGFEVASNHPFKGGYITRNNGKPKCKQYAIQLELSKDLYMSNDEMQYDEAKALPIQQMLKTIFTQLGDSIV